MRWRRFTPASSRRARLLLAAVVWSAVGIGLVATGVVWLSADERTVALALLGVGLALGWAKGRWILGRVASRNARRILESDEGRCLGGAFSWGAWAAALGFSLLGFLSRRSSIPRSVLGAVYVTAGVALLLASAVAWKHWWRLRATGGTGGAS